MVLVKKPDSVADQVSLHSSTGILLASALLGWWGAGGHRVAGIKTADPIAA